MPWTPEPDTLRDFVWGLVIATAGLLLVGAVLYGGLEAWDWLMRWGRR